MFVTNHVLESGFNQFAGVNRCGDSKSSGARGNHICNVLPITLNHVPSYNERIDKGDVRYKGKVVVDDGPSFEGDESTID